jgi:hypothetical protein
MYSLQDNCGPVNELIVAAMAMIVEKRPFPHLRQEGPVLYVDKAIGHTFVKGYMAFGFRRDRVTLACSNTPSDFTFWCYEDPSFPDNMIDHANQLYDVLGDV